MLKKKSQKTRSASGRKDIKPTLLIDAPALAYGAFYRFGSFSYDRKPTGVIYGFLRSILSLARKFDTNKFIFAWDWPGELYREQTYPTYKKDREEKRKKMTSKEISLLKAMFKQREIIMDEVLPDLGFMNNHCIEYLEADDIIAWWAIRNYRDYRKSIIVSSDNDLYQLLMYAPMYITRRKKIFNMKDFEKKFHIHPESWIRAKAIGGCSGDSVEGISGIGDPKNPGSMALKYLRGELNETSKAYGKITSNMGRAIIDRNIDLVMLPHPIYQRLERPRMIMRRDKFSIRKAIKTFDKHHFKSLLDEKNFKHWRRYFS